MTVPQVEPRIVCQVETHVVVAIPVTIWHHPQDGYVIDYGQPRTEPENPFPSDGAEIWDSTLEDWHTHHDLAATYNIPADVALAAYIGPNFDVITLEQP